jgi:starch-binding outer membrane protein, SusD/RagB family
MKLFNVLIIILVLNLFSCKKFLKQEPYNTISITDIFKDFEGARTVLVNCYDNLKSFNYYSRDLTVYADLVGGNIKYSKPTNQILQQTYNFNNDAVINEWKPFFETAYNIIYSCNAVLENVENAKDANIFQKNRMVADAKTIRALVHFDLVKTFAQMPSFTTNASHTGITIRRKNTNASQLPDPQSTVAQVYNFVHQELDSAIILYNNSVQIYTTGSDRTWLSANAAKALQCRVALYQNDWNKVISLSNQLIIPAYPLISNANYVNAWRGKVLLSESIFELDYGNRIAGSLGDYYNNLSTTFQFATTNDLLNLYDPLDVRAKATMYNSYTVNSTPFSFSKKYNGIRDSANNMRLFRISEVILSRAEAYAETGNLTAALTDLNIIKKRGWPLSPTFTSTIQQDVINEILKERRKELCFEGHLFYDITRKKNNITRTDCQASINCNINYPSPLLAIPLPIN